MRIILLGAPGVGKGTQADFISQRLGIPAISTGNLIRDAVSKGSETGRKLKSYIDKGQLVPDEVVTLMLKERISLEDCKNGYILDGFPRTVKQAEALSEMGIEIDKVIDIELSDDEILRRLSGRRVCSSCGATYHILHNRSKKDNRCDKCDSALTVRDDDKPETILERLNVYHAQTEPLINYYKDKGILSLVSSCEKVSDTNELMLEALGATV